jgi:hypothetical protein
MVNTTIGSKVLILGDFSNFLIADHIGATVEIVSHLVGANHRPTGEPGAFFLLAHRDRGPRPQRLDVPRGPVRWRPRCTFERW